MKIRNSTLLLIALLCGLTPLHSQPTMTLSEALALGLERNYGIRIAANEARIPALTNSLGEAGFLPTLTAGAGADRIQSDIEFFEDDQSQGKGSALEFVYDAELALSWTLFDGFQMFTNKKHLHLLEEMGSTKAQITIENIVSDITNAYLEVVGLTRRLEASKNNLEISQERERIARTKLDLGSGSEYDLLVAQTDLNADRSAIIRQEADLLSARLELFRLLQLEADNNWVITGDIDTSNMQTLNELRKEVAENNPELAAARLQSSAKTLELRKIQQSRLPTVEARAALFYNSEELRTSPLTRENNTGYYLGLGARLPLFDGFAKKRAAATARIEMENSQLQQEELSAAIDMHLIKTWENYQNSRQLYHLENQNLELANRTLTIALERFRLANITSIELREAQRSLINTENRLIDALFETKIYETELRRLSGSLHELISTNQ